MKASPSNGEEYYNYYQLGLGILSLGMTAKSLATQSGTVINNANGSYKLSKNGVNVGYTVVEGNISKMNISYYTSNGHVYKTVQVNTALLASGVADISQSITNMYFTTKGMLPY
ncbi:hypothetical protein M3661_07660 [Paenibacillus sp. MER 180]|uniref:hypothetical protein n=1 Tax=Paenibacillus sp. MER 180 TaxID=2939570 RepID=UPI002040C911|nr:hypothetical protein [Paenibacillus sp. MER 180]MCM3290001.1 hypothetical protein [Paenibacillus sp. MER 180]